MSVLDPHVVAVLGAGTMGHGIAQVTAAAGFTTRIYDVKAEAADAGLSKVKGTVARLVEKKKLPEDGAAALLGRLSATSDLRAAVEGATIVIEAAPESMELKVELFRSVINAVSASTLLASNTSSLSITELGRRIGAGDRTVGYHFFNPPPVMELLEVVRGFETSDKTLDRSLDFAKRIGKTAIVVRDFPGFATSRLGVCIGAEAMRMLEQGVAGVADIDRAMELGYRHPMGPLKLTDLVGLDVRLSIADYLRKELDSAVFEAPRLMRDMVSKGQLGKKSGKGFYDWT